MENATKALFIAIFIVILITIIFIVLYLLPSILAIRKKCKNLSKIILINVFLGWTIIGWLISLFFVISITNEE